MLHAGKGEDNEYCIFFTLFFTYSLAFVTFFSLAKKQQQLVLIISKFSTESLVE